MNTKIRHITLSFVLLLITCLNSQAKTFNIPNGDIKALINAINEVNSNKEADIINLAKNGVYNFNAFFEKLNIGKPKKYKGNIALPQIKNDDVQWNTPNTLDLTIEGNGSTFIRKGGGDYRFFYIHIYAYVKIDGITFRNGVGLYRGGAIYAGWRTKTEINNCKFYNNKTKGNEGTFDQGGGAVMCAAESQLWTTYCYFEGNQANGLQTSLKGNGGGAIMYLLSNLLVQNCKFCCLYWYN